MQCGVATSKKQLVADDAIFVIRPKFLSFNEQKRLLLFEKLSRLQEKTTLLRKKTKNLDLFSYT